MIVTFLSPTVEVTPSMAQLMALLSPSELEKHVATLVCMLQDEDGDVRDAAKETLKKLSPGVLDGQAPALVSQLQDSNWISRR